MSESHSPPPSWVRKRDGRLVPFEADRISRALFAATERNGRPDAFLARELADVAVHFLAEESEGTTPTTEQVQDVVLKVLRELNQHSLAAAYEESAREKQMRPSLNGNGAAHGKGEVVFRFSPCDPLPAVRDACLRSYTLEAVFTRDLVAAHHDGFITLGGLETPGELAACLVGPLYRPEDLVARLEEAAGLAGRTLVLDGIEQVILRRLPRDRARVSTRRLEDEAAQLADNLAVGLRLTGRQAVVNLNAPPPAWTEDDSGGPLFAPRRKNADPELRARLADVLAEVLREKNADHVRIDWHLSEKDFGVGSLERRVPLTRAVLAGAPIAFVYDRSRQPVSLAEGVLRTQPAVLLTVGLNLPRLAALVGNELSGSVSRSDRLRERLSSLVRLALSAALQKREYLRLHVREHPELARGFLMERARLLVAPLGLDEAVRMVVEQGICAGDAALEVACGFLTRLRDVLRDEGRAAALECCLDALPDHDRAGPTCHDPDAFVKAQLRAIGALHGAAGGGSGIVFLPHDPPPTAEQVAGWLRWAWTQTSVCRVRFLRARSPLRQMTFSEE